ncbi:MAG: T9SS type A sorting domain-containing protein, partial [Candidatus Neomarinimicrobiota bacterium]
TVTDASQYSFLAWDAWKDDGVVVYLNGTEVLRGNMPTGTISYDSYAVGSEHSHVTLETDASLLVDGENVVAVSLHNKDSDVTGDRSLDLHLVGKRVVLSVDSDPGGLTPQAYRLFQNYPNPFNPATTIRYSISRGGYVNLSLYDLTGRLVNTLVSEQRTPGEHAVRWNGINASGRAVSSGIYLYRLEVNGVVLTRRMVFIK